MELLRPARLRLVFLFGACLILSSLQTACAAVEVKNIRREREWIHDTVQAFQHTDSIERPPENVVWFVGSSSIERWEKLADDFKMPLFKRGIGATKIRDWIDLADRIVT